MRLVLRLRLAVALADFMADLQATHTMLVSPPPRRDPLAATDAAGFFTATALQQVMLRRMQADLDASNFERNSQGLAPYPDLNEVWSIRALFVLALAARRLLIAPSPHVQKCTKKSRAS